jgi:hypothetical protein
MAAGELFEGLRASADVAQADWIRERPWPWRRGGPGVEVGSIIPGGFEAYAPILHPALRWRDATPPIGEPEYVTWAEVASWSGTSMQTGVPFAWLEERPDGSVWSQSAPPGVDHTPPQNGEPSPALEVRMAQELAGFTSTPEHVWYCIWSGWGDMEPPYPGVPEVTLPSREYYLFEGPLDGIANFLLPRLGGFYRAPNLWWPDDRAWCVASEIDFCCTYVGGPREAIEAIVARDDVEGFEVTPGDTAETTDPRYRDT